MTIAGSDSGGGAGIQADLRTFAMLGVHGLVAVTAVTVQNSVGVKGFHEIPLDVIAGQIEAVASDIGVQAAKTGMLASSAIIDTIADTWRGQGLAGTVPLVVDPVCASMHGDPLLHPSALDSLKGQLFPLATLVTPNLDEVRLLVDVDVVDDTSQREAARALHALGPQVGAGQGRSPALVVAQLPTCCSTAPTSTSSTRRASTPATTTAPVTRSPRPSRVLWPTATPCPMRLPSGKAG